LEFLAKMNALRALTDLFAFSLDGIGADMVQSLTQIFARGAQLEPLSVFFGHVPWSDASSGPPFLMGI